ncbi:MAG: hypothetical protein KGI54_15460 [Pseudomonadota bacterium]|nr:hypothetical protein [Pseudomonadota bacterium]
MCLEMYTRFIAGQFVEEGSWPYTVHVLPEDRDIYITEPTSWNNYRWFLNVPGFDFNLGEREYFDNLVKTYKEGQYRKRQRNLRDKYIKQYLDRIKDNEQI